MIATAPPGLDAAQRLALERLVIRARALLESDLAAQAEGRYGIHLNGTIEDEGALPDDTTDRMTRRDLEEVVTHLRTLGEDSASAVARLLREAAFTHLNRLVAIRIAESIGLLPESLAKGPQSRGFKDFGEIMPMLAGDFRAYVRLCGDELASDAPALFDPRNPLLFLQPSTTAFDELIALVADPATTEIWPAPDTLGWAYQFFNTSDERREMREESAPRNSHELAVRNQFFTPRYVVDFLVQNTIGRRIAENDPTSPLVDEMPMLVDPPTEQGPALKLDEVKCLDPACGSGHFLLGCYDVLERAWELAGVAPSESAPRIVASLWGVDIDVRCAQVASAAIVLRARRFCRDIALPPPNIVTARGLPGGSAALPSDVELTAEQRDLIDRISAVLDKAPLLGTLLKAEEALELEIRHGLFGGKAGTLAITDAAAKATERELLSHLQAIADRASSSVGERLFAAEADDALRLVEVVRQRYDAVLMNPPFGEAVPETKPYLRAAYPWIPTRDYNLLAAFVGRGLELCKPDGYLGAITSRAGMFLTTFENWRRAVFLGNRLRVLVDLGYGVMEQAMVEAAAYVLGPGRPSPDHEGTFIRLLKDTDRVVALEEAVEAARLGREDRRVFRVQTADFGAVPGVPIAYWMSSSIRRLFADLPKLEGNGADVRVGLQTGDDFQFVRTFWEIDPRRVGRSRAETLAGKRWVPLAKGGDYSPYWSDIHLVVNYESDGQILRDFPGSVIRNPQYYFRAGVTWPKRTASGFGPRILPAACIFSQVGYGAFARHDQAVLLGVMSSRLFEALVLSFIAAGEETTSGSPAKEYTVGVVQQVPWLGQALGESSLKRVSEIALQIAARRQRFDRQDEATPWFVGPTSTGTARAAGLLQTVNDEVDVRLEGAVEAIVLSFELEGVLHRELDLAPQSETYLNDEIGPHPAGFPDDHVDPEDEFLELYEMPMEPMIDRLVKNQGGSRNIATQTFIADRRLEILAHVFRRHPRALNRTRREHGVLAPGEQHRLADDLISYLIGGAFGRWDLRIGRDPSSVPPISSLFDPPPVCPPGMLADLDGMPASVAPSDYPVALPPTRLLIDEPGHWWDIEAAILRSAVALFDDPSSMLQELLEALGHKTIRDYLRKQFFKDHLSRYSKSRRKAPIYWPLTVPSKNWGIWVYAPMLSRETLYGVASEAGRRERLAGEAIARLQREKSEGGAGRAVRKVAAELDAEERLAEELRKFRSEAERVAGLGWQPDLDDGSILCAAPLAELIPSWPDAKTARTELRRGEYQWATVAAWANQL